MSPKVLLSLALSLFLSSVGPSDANEESLSPLFAAIHAGDMAKVEALLGSADLSGEARYEQQRLFDSVFNVADPRIFNFVKTWLEARPDVAASHLAAAKMLHSMAYRARGEELSRFTYPDAMNLYSTLMSQAAEEAWRAYEIEPDNVVTVDLIMGLRDRMPGKPDRMTVLAKIMETSPNWVTVVNAAGSYAPQWGGSVEQMTQVCDVYAPVSNSEPPITSDFCRVYSAYDASLPWSFLDEIDPLLTASDDPRLDFARRARVMRTFDFTEESAAMFQAYLGDPSTMDVKAARYYDGYARAHGLPTFEVEVTNRAIADARRKIADQPYSSSLLKLLATPSTQRIPIESPPSWEEGVALKRKRLAYSPYNSEFWQDYAEALVWAARGQTQDSDDAYRNAIVYSNYKPERIEAYMQSKGGLLTEFLFLRSQGRFSERFPEGYASVATDLTCPLVALLRFHDAVCTEGGAGAHCETAPSVIDEYRTMTNIPIADGSCDRERNAPLEQIAYVPKLLTAD